LKFLTLIALLCIGIFYYRDYDSGKVDLKQPLKIASFEGKHSRKNKLTDLKKYNIQEYLAEKNTLLWSFGHSLVASAKG
jgi:hypothetical protein